MNTQLVLQLYIELSPLIDLKHEHTHKWLDGSATISVRYEKYQHC